jgi:hypothetical protein
MREITKFALKVKRPSSLPTVRDQTDIMEYGKSAKFEVLAFDSIIISDSNTVANDTTTATHYAQNSATSQIRLSG